MIQFSRGGHAHAQLIWTLAAAVVFIVLSAPLLAGDAAPEAETVAQKARAAAGAGQLEFRSTTPDDVRALLGPPDSKETDRDGGYDVLFWRYDGAQAVFGRNRERPGEGYVLYELSIGGEPLDIGRNRQVVLKSVSDIGGLDAFTGLQNVSLANLDLRNAKKLLDTMNFDTRTVWPPKGMLPDGFDPERLLHDGKYPGLGLRALHKEGIDGRGVGIAIIDQPLVRNHVEYAERMKAYIEIDVEGVPAQMHGPSVASIAVGKTCGVAPGADLYYYSIPMWEWKSCAPYTETIEKILALNDTLEPSRRIRAVSISQGMFPEWPGYEKWKKTLAKAAASGVLVVTCDQNQIRYGTLQRIPGTDPDDAASYVKGKYWSAGSRVLVPTGNRTRAGYTGPQGYAFDRQGGMSWAAPYLAGLAALACQVDSGVTPETTVELLSKTVTRTKAGPVVNPRGFIDAVRKGKAARSGQNE